VTDADALVAEALDGIAAIDLSLVRMKLAHAPARDPWSESTLSQAHEEYVQFLVLTYAYPGEVLVPSRLADMFWHQHILDTRAYARDCEHLFGFFLHHFPYLGLRGSDDAAELRRRFDRTNVLRNRHFEAVSVASADCSSYPDPSDCSSCGNNDWRI
jgi:hypothetical protein